MREIYFTVIALGTLIFIGCSNSAEPTSVPKLDPTPLSVSTEASTAEPGPTAVAPATSVVESALLDPIYELDVGWTKIDPGGETRCAHDTEFSFWVRPGTTNKLLVYFQGGGGCWNWETCQPGSGLYDQTVTERDSPAPRGGILDFSKEANPFSEYNVVYVPSCTGDIYLGDNIETYEQEGQEPYDVYHHGYVNLNSALQWAYENVLDPESIFVTGCSAGSIGSIRAAPHLIHNYPNAEVTQLGDSLGFLFNQPDRIDQIYGSHHTFPDWIPAFAGFDPDAFRMADFYNTVMDYYPDYRFAQFNTERDRVQLRYHLAGGDPEETFAAALAGAISDIHVFSPNFRSYMADGDVHCIMPGQGFYNREVNGVLFRDWVADLAAGADVQNVQCRKCGVVYEGWEGLPSSHSQVGQWEQIGIMPNARSENRGVEINGKFYIPGGWGGESLFEAYDPSVDSWEALADLPEGRHHFMVTKLDNKMYLFGGSAENAYRPETNAWMYDSESDQWTILTEMPQPRLAGGAVTAGDLIYIVGGSSGSDEVPTLRYDPSSDEWTELAPLNQQSEHVAAVALGNKIYLFGGWDQPGIEFTRMEIYDVASDSWENGGGMRFKRGGLAAAVLDDQIYVVGGELLSSGQTKNHVEIYDPATTEWSEPPALPVAIHGFPLISYDNSLWIIGGSDLAGGEENEGRMFRYRPRR